MSRGRNGSETETSRVRAQERFASSRGNGKTNAGTQIPDGVGIKKGFGSEFGMQRNPKKSPAPKF